MGMNSDNAPCFRPATEAEMTGFGPDCSALAHYVSHGPYAAPATSDATEELRRREALSRLIAGAFDR